MEGLTAVVMPSLALKQVIFWAFALVAVGIISGGAAKVGAQIVARWFPKEEKKDRRGEPNWMHEFAGLQRDSILSNNGVVQSVKELAETLTTLSRSYDRLSKRTFDEHAEIVTEVRALDVPRRRHHD